ncbi:polyphosphate polymerase domain-containing protein [Nitriliruptoraceae bacterium ZYF776]|nr:polyphosphate polymerase domain-containing protein [Profundirhabdus halotolerans]
MRGRPRARDHGVRRPAASPAGAPPGSTSRRHHRCRGAPSGGGGHVTPVATAAPRRRPVTTGHRLEDARRDLAAAAITLPPIGLAELDAAAALQRRIDVKYLVPARTFLGVLLGLEGDPRVLTIDGQRTFAYRSVYLDTPDLATYRAHVQGRRLRCKVRVRTYLDTGGRFLELKLEGRRGGTVKHRMPYDGPEDRLSAEGRAFLDEHLLAAHGRPAPEGLRATVRTDYHRTTFALARVGERVTVDTALEGEHAGRRLRLVRRDVLLESKSATGRGAVDRALRREGIRPVRISKHAATVAGTRAGEQGNAWRRALRHFEVGDVPAAPAAAVRAG